MRNAHDRVKIISAQACQNWQPFACVMHLHENHSIRRTGVAGRRARAKPYQANCYEHNKY